MARFSNIVETLESRIQQGDYRLRPFPSVAELAQELQANPRTITKALDELVSRGIIARLPTGRISVAGRTVKKNPHLAMLASSYPTPFIDLWYRTFEQMVSARGWQLKNVRYSHWQDAAIADTLRGFDGIFLSPLDDNLPSNLLPQLQPPHRKVIVIEQDFSDLDLPSIRFLTPSSIHKLLDHVRVRWKGKVACLNTQPVTRVVRERIEHWKLWTAVHNAAGPFINEPVPLFGSALEHAYQIVHRALKRGELDSKILFCVTGAAAIGAMRAITDCGHQPGKDFAVCAADDNAGQAKFLCPSLTCLTDPPWEPYLRICLDWLGGGSREWAGPLLVQPAEVSVFVGESTNSGKAPSPSSKKRRAKGAFKAHSRR